jgi:hypothetical protein
MIGAAPQHMTKRQSAGYHRVLRCQIRLRIKQRVYLSHDPSGIEAMVIPLFEANPAIDGIAFPNAVIRVDMSPKSETISSSLLTLPSTTKLKH